MWAFRICHLEHAAVQSIINRAFDENFTKKLVYNRKLKLEGLDGMLLWVTIIIEVSSLIDIESVSSCV